MTMPLRQRIRQGDTLIGTFIKTPSHQAVEILGHAGLDFAVVDQEHAPIDLGDMDRLALAARATGLPMLSRRWGASTDWIAPLLDLGLAGVMVPHVADRAQADQIAAAVKFAHGARGISPSPRAGNYGGMGLIPYRDRSDAESVIMVQIEDASALDHLDAIAACPDVDLLFIGPADLSQSLGVAFPSAELDAAIARIIEAGRHAGVAVGLFVGDAGQIPVWRERGVTLFVCGSDQSMLRKAAERLMADSRISEKEETA